MSSREKRGFLARPALAMHSPTAKARAWNFIASVTSRIDDIVCKKFEGNLLGLPLVVATAELFNYMDRLRDHKVAELFRIPIVVTEELQQIVRYIKYVESHRTPFTNLTVLLHGLPGTGKSFAVAMAQAVAQHAQQNNWHDDIVYRSSKSSRNDGAGSCSEAKTAPSLDTAGRITIHYLNEVDRYLDDSLSEAALLGLLDEPKRSLDKKSVTILTTNYLERLPEVLRRPGRIDLIIEMKGMTESEARQMMKLYEFKGDLPPKNAYGKYNPADIYEHMRKNSKICD